MAAIKKNARAVFFQAIAGVRSVMVDMYKEVVAAEAKKVRPEPLNQNIVESEPQNQNNQNGNSLSVID